MLKSIDKKMVFGASILFLAPFLAVLWFLVDWQSNLTIVVSELNVFFDSNYGISISFLGVMVLAYIFLGILKILIFNNDGGYPSKLFMFLFMESIRIYLISMGTFLLVTSVVFEGDGQFTTDTFFIITFLVFIVTWGFYLLLRSISNYLFKNSKVYANSKATEIKLFNLYEVNGIVYFFVTAVTVLILADTIGNTAFDSVMSQIKLKETPSEPVSEKEPSLDDFTESRLFSLIIPSLTIYILSIRTTLPKGIKKE